MTYEEFKASLSGSKPDTSLPLALKGLWYDAKGDWEHAHACAQEAENIDGAWVHGYLHRKEGDISNAQYWYRRADRTIYRGPLEKEWEEIVKALL